MKTFDFATLGVEELSKQEMITNHGGGDSTSIGNIGSILVADLVDVSGNSLFNGDSYLFSGNTTDLSPVTNLVFGLSSTNS